MSPPRRVRDVVQEVEHARQRAFLYERARMFIFQRYGHPDREKEIDYHVVSSVVEQLLVLANDAQQRAEALLAAPVANERGERHVRQR